MDTLVEDKRKVTLFEKMRLRFYGKEIRPVNEFKCPGCGKWDHEQNNDPTWNIVTNKEAYISIVNPGHKIIRDESYEQRTCECGKVTRWIDTGFMSVRAQIFINEDGEAIWGTFDHIMEKRR